MPENNEETIINEILPFAPAGTVQSGDVMELAEYKQDIQRLRGHQPGIARRELENTALRQASHMAVGVAEFIAQKYTAGVRDDGDAEKIVEGLRYVIEQMILENATTSYPSAFQSFYEQIPPKGWKVRNGAVLSNAEEAYPKLWEALQEPKNAWKCKSLTSWTALSSTSGGVGGVPFFVLDKVAKSIKLPDTRGDYERGAGSSYLSAVGAWHGDAIRNILGKMNQNGVISSLIAFLGGTGALLETDTATATFNTGGTSKTSTRAFNFDASRVVPTANENRTRAFAVLPCVYVGGI